MKKSIEKLQYKKPPKTIKEQINILKNRGLVIASNKELAYYLENISYYHLSSYFKAFQKNKDIFNENTTLDKVINLYEFDKKLRLLMLDVTERIEKSFKCRIIYNISIKTKNSHWHSDIASYKNKEVYNRYIADCLDNAQYKNDIDYKYYYNKYEKPDYPPAWTFFEALSFGQSVSFYRNLNTSFKKIIAKTFNIQQYYLTSWMYGISTVRNISAHHSRLWNREILASMKTDHFKYKELFNQNKLQNLYNYLLVIFILMKNINPTSTWFERFLKLVKEHKMDLALMGFPDNWIKNFKKLEME